DPETRRRSRTALNPKTVRHNIYMKTSIYYISVILFISWTSCNESEKSLTNDVESIDTSYISENLKKHFYPINSFWIFESNSGDKDSVKFTRIEKEILDPIITHGQVNVGYLETYKFHYYSTKKGYYWDQYIGSVIVRNGIDWANGEYIFLSDSRIGASSDEATIDTIYDSYIVSDRTYRNVVRMRIVNFEFESGEDWYYYFADSIGIIKKEKLVNEPNNKIWNLIDTNL
ncbi:MAG: hypothetical protein KQH79_05965, partial [Bacteroidetes bacterium]|nr:hypothetical protein [Bacteroidota bacterium]